ncbi:hypothetical protein ABT369_53225 [Dactylosporangium sp. NPDC000244]|uniref:hypothetical protein n=1 Tax=Dactylosporangium sp. NPDC000244 TaxID=3154365 RepID=UPI003323D1A4
MTDPIETLVRRAQQERAAATTPDLDRILAALPALRRRRARRRRTGFALAAVAAILAVVAIVLLPVGTPERNLPAGPPSARPSPTRSEPLVAMPYELEHPPGDYRERLRTIEEGPTWVTASRIYTETPLDPLASDAGSLPHLTLTVRAGGLPEGEPVGVGAVRGVLVDGLPDSATVTWPARLGGVVSFEAVRTGLSRTQVLQLAASVADHSLWLDKRLILGWTPGEEPVIRYTQSLMDADRWSATVTADASAEDRGILTATLAPGLPARQDSQFASLHARPASFYEDPYALEVDQRLPDNDLALMVRYRQGGAPPLTREEFLAAAEAIEVRG